MTISFDDLLKGINNPAITAAKLNLPTGVEVEETTLALPLMDFQTEALQHALRDTLSRGYGYNALEMGLGKTPIGIAVADACVKAGQRPVLIVVPPAVRINWGRELSKFAPWLTWAPLTGKSPDVTAPLPDVDVLVIGDSSVNLDKWTETDEQGRRLIPPVLESHGWAEYLAGKVAALVVDEAHRFKNKSTRATALKIIGKATPGFRYLMSGTPTPNGRHQELANQIDILGDQAWRDIGGKGLFWQHYAPKVDQYSRGNNDGAALFQAMSKSWYFRRLRANVIELPAKGRTALALEGRGRAKAQYVKAEADLIQFLRDKQGGQVSWGQQRAQALIKLMTLRHLAGMAKAKAVVDHAKEILDEEPGGLFVVAEHSDVIEELLYGLNKYDPAFIQGGMSDKERQTHIDAFCNGDARVLVGQIQAAGIGLTLHGGGINHHVIVAQLPWTPADLKQAEDRLHRIGQTHDVEVEVALCSIEGHVTIDERLWAQLETKNWNATLISDGEAEVLLNEVIDGVLDSYA